MTNNKLVTEVQVCRVCDSSNLRLVLDLGSTPLANSFLTEKELLGKERSFPLKVKFCVKCGQLQLSHAISPDILFRKYLYVSSTSSVFVNHFNDYAKQVYNNYHLNKGSLVVDIGSNDGILLKPFKALGCRILGVDPAREISRKATKEGIETIPAFFNATVAKNILRKYGYASVITGNNVFAHVPDIDEILKGVNVLLDNEGVFVVEFPYLVDFIQKNLFDLVYHEHSSYFSVRPLVKLFERFNMQIIDVIKVSSHGGSIRVFVKKDISERPVKSSVRKFITQEVKLGLNDINTYLKFARRVENNKKKLIELLNKLKIKNKQIIGYGAPAKGNTLLNYFRVSDKIIDYIIDDSPLKQGLYTPGTHVPITSSEILNDKLPDYILILAWNFAEPIIEKYGWVKSKGVKFIIPIPYPKII